jgi:two-component system KDP operon response regulator KdpE
MEKVRILVVDDDNNIIELLSSTLSLEGWQVLSATNGMEALKKAEEILPDLVLLDIMMPVMDGFEICRRLRQRSQIPIIALSARADVGDKIKCLNLGADDYVTKPFRVDELIARINATLRRNKIIDTNPQEPVFIYGDIKIDFKKRQVLVRGTETLLTPTEYNLLVELSINAGKTLTYDNLLSRIWGLEFVKERDYLYVHINHLREKIESEPQKPRYIVSIPRIGYRFQQPE